MGQKAVSPWDCPSYEMLPCHDFCWKIGNTWMYLEKICMAPKTVECAAGIGSAGASERSWVDDFPRQLVSITSAKGMWKPEMQTVLFVLMYYTNLILLYPYWGERWRERENCGGRGRELGRLHFQSQGAIMKDHESSSKLFILNFSDSWPAAPVLPKDLEEEETIACA